MSSLPDILKVQPLPSVDTMTIHTEVLDPITITASQAVFQIPRTGILDGGSFIQLGATCTAGQNQCFFPLTTGVGSMIDSVLLKVGGQVVSSTEDFGQYHTMMRQFQTPEHRSHIGMVKEGTCGDRWGTNNGTLATNTGNGRIGYKDLAYDATGTTAEVPNFIRITSDDATTPLFSIQLSQLIPMMKSRQLPLFAMKENVYLIINFTQQNTAADIGKMACFGGVAPVGALAKVVPSAVNIKFVSDHLYYEDETMAQTAAMIQQEGGLAFLYEDLILTTSQIEGTGQPPVGTPLQQVQQREIAVSGRTVRSLYIADKPQLYTHVLLGDYVSKSPITETQVNYRINDQRVYDRGLQSPSRKYHELALTAGRPLMTPSQIYSFDADANKTLGAVGSLNQFSISNATIEGLTPVPAVGAGFGGTGFAETDPRGCSHYMGLDLSINGLNELGNGRLIGVKPIELDLTYLRTNQDYEARTVRTWAMVERTASIVKGEINISA
tara:strand:+ start:5095 stop:6582 length:1488 start_codon:yes stop_codon:yes gene_type:complete